MDYNNSGQFLHEIISCIITFYQPDHYYSRLCRGGVGVAGKVKSKFKFQKSIFWMWNQAYCTNNRIHIRDGRGLKKTNDRKNWLEKMRFEWGSGQIEADRVAFGQPGVEEWTEVRIVVNNEDVSDKCRLKWNWRMKCVQQRRTWQDWTGYSW